MDRRLSVFLGVFLPVTVLLLFAVRSLSVSVSLRVHSPSSVFFFVSLAVRHSLSLFVCLSVSQLRLPNPSDHGSQSPSESRVKVRPRVTDVPRPGRVLSDSPSSSPLPPPGTQGLEPQMDPVLTFIRGSDRVPVVPTLPDPVSGPWSPGLCGWTPDPLLIVYVPLWTHLPLCISLSVPLCVTVYICLGVTVQVSLSLHLSVSLCDSVCATVCVTTYECLLCYCPFTQQSVSPYHCFVCRYLSVSLVPLSVFLLLLSCQWMCTCATLSVTVVVFGSLPVVVSPQVRVCEYASCLCVVPHCVLGCLCHCNSATVVLCAYFGLLFGESVCTGWIDTWRTSGHSYTEDPWVEDGIPSDTVSPPHGRSLPNPGVLTRRDGDREGRTSCRPTNLRD